MNKQIITSLLAIAAILVMVGGATYAFFSSSSTSTGNTFSTGTLTLALSDNNETNQASVSASFGGTLAPGQCTGPQTLNLKNTGSIAANHTEVTLANVVTDTNNDASPDMDSFLKVKTLTFDGVDKKGQISASAGNANGFEDLADWAADPNVLDNLSLTDLNTNHPLVMDVCLDDSAGNTLQGDSVSSTFTVTLNQDASQ